jgi:Uma2 family endonuclease
MTLAEFLQQPEVKPARELRHGRVSQKVSPSGPHGSIQLWFGHRIEGFLESTQAGRAFTETRLLLGEETYVPDLVMYRWDRIPEDEYGNLPTYFQTPPDLVVEIISPGQTLSKQLERCRELIEHGVAVTVLVHPGQQAVYLVRPGGQAGPLHAGDTIDLTDIVPGFQLPITDLFAQMRARPPRS